MGLRNEVYRTVLRDYTWFLSARHCDDGAYISPQTTACSPDQSADNKDTSIL
jgi:hypothetical protein